MMQFFAKLFSTDAIISRIIRGFTLASAYVAGLNHPPSDMHEWLAVIGAFLGGLIPAGQNNGKDSTPVGKHV